MRIQINRSQIRQIRLTMIAMVLVGTLSIGDSLFAQPGMQQGSDSKQGPPGGPGGDPFQLPADGKFQLPGVQPLPGDDPAAGPVLQSFQNVVVNEKYAGWRQAGDGSTGNRLDEVLRSQWVMADETGKVSGVVFGIEGADVGNLKVYLLNNGRLVNTVSPQEDGTFVFSNIREGVYALVGWGDNAFFGFSFNLLNFNPEVNENVPTELKVTATPNETTINTDWIQFFAKQVEFPVYGRHETGEAEEDEARLYGISGQSLFLPPARPATSISSHQIIPASDGRVIGRVHQMSYRNGRPVDLQNTRIMLLKDDDVYAAVTTDSYGVFEFPEIPAGEYSCVAVGKDGLGCIGIYLSEPADDEETEFTPISFTMMTSETTGWLHDLAIETAYQRVISRPRSNYDENNQACNSCGQHGCNGGCCQGGGGRALRPGGYRPPPKSAIPKEERFIPRANRFIDSLFFKDSRGNFGGFQGQGGYNGYQGTGYSGYQGNGYGQGPANGF